MAEEGLVAFFGRLAAYQDRHLRVGQFAGVEVGFARALWVCEQSARAADGVRELQLVSSQSHGLDPDTVVRRPRLHVRDHQLAELAAIRARLVDGGVLERLRALAGHPPPGTAQPGDHTGLGRRRSAHRPPGPDGTHAETALLMVVADLRAGDPTVLPHRLWRLLALAWSDSEHDRNRIRQVGLVLPRHGHLSTWTVPEFAERLLAGTAPVEQARSRWLQVARQAR